MEMYELGTGRLVPSVMAVLALISVVVASVGLRRRQRRAAYLATGLAAVAVIVGGLHAANAGGGLGTGNGLAGAVVAVVLGVAGAAVAGLTLYRTS